ncbi:MAG TPA: hypothetical protein VI072_10565 [Polyangiaceae bacterium]
MLRHIRKAPFVLAFVLLASCGGDDDDGTKEPLGGVVGAACTADAQCKGYENAACVRDIKPLEDVIDPNDTALKPFRDLTLPFPGGYCSTTIQNACANDAQCGEGAGCFIAFEGMSPDVIENLAKALPFDIKFFSRSGICMKRCTSNSECRTGQKYQCIRPLEAFIKAINDDYDKKFCVQDVDVEHLLLGSSPDGG